MLKFSHGGARKTFPSLERETGKLRGIMNSSMFKYRKTNGCYPIAFFIKTFLIHPPTTYLQPVCIAKESMQHVFLSGERGGPSKMVESRFLFVGIRESKRMLHMAFFIKTFLIHSPTTYLQPVYVAKESMQHVFLSGERGGPS